MADVREPLSENGREVSALIAAAPEMARLLLEIGEAIRAGTVSEDDACECIERVLKKAGVLP